MKIEIKENVVTNEGDEIGIIQDGVCHLTKSVGPTVKAAIKKESDITELKFVVGDAPDVDDAPGGTEGEDGLTVKKIVQAKVILDDGDENETVDIVPGSMVLPSSNPPPERDPILGDKCPKYLAWKEGK